MKRKTLYFPGLVILVLVFLAGSIIMGCLSSPGIYYRPGIYHGRGQGYRGDINVKVWLSESGIEDIEILKHREDDFAAAAMEELRELTLETGSADMDVISGATVSSSGFLSALEEALTKGGSTR